MAGIIFFIVLIVLVLWILASCIRIVPQAYAIVVERLGAYKDHGTQVFISKHHLLTVWQEESI